MASQENDPFGERNRRKEAEINARLMSCETIPKKAIFSSSQVGRFFGVSPSVIGNWASRYETFPNPIGSGKTTQPTLYDIREVIQWWIHWNPDNRNKSGEIPDNWKVWF